MPIQLYLSFFIAALVLIYAPGPVNVLTMSQALQTGWRHALPCVWGSTCAVLLQLLLTALCLNSLLTVSQHALAVLRWVGAAYLVWLGYKQWRSSSLACATEDPADPAEVAGRALFWRGFATSGLNPKTLLFFPSFFPQFISTSAPWSTNHQYLVLAATFAVLFAGGMASMAVFSHRMRDVLRQPLRVRAVNRLMGSTLVGMGALLAGLR